jgi:inner membrane protein involved in colicin E2 resistance
VGRDSEIALRSDWASPSSAGTLYGLVGADDYALLMGSILLFALLAAVMILTRRVDWFALGQREEANSA